MNIQWKKYAPLGLYLSLLAALFAGSLYIVQRSFSLPVQVSLGLIVIGPAIFILLDPERARQALTGRQARYGSNALVMVLAFAGIVGIANYLAYKNSPQWDLTADKEHTLASETLDTLQKLDSPVVAQAFFSQRYPYPTDTARNLLQSYQEHSKGQFTYEFIDPDADPVRAQAANIVRDGTIVLAMQDRQEQVTYASEQEITSGLVRLANPGERSVYFLTGHGEHDPAGSDEASYSQVKTSLETKNYTVGTLNLLSSPSVPEDARAIVIAGPLKPLSDNEVALLKSYLDQGGSVVALLEPPALTESPEASDPLSGYLAENWGVQPGSDIVLDPNVNPPVIAIAETYGTHSITEKLMQMATLFPTSRSLAEGVLPEGITLETLVQTSPNAWGETDIDSIQNNQVTTDPNADVTGPVTLAVAGSSEASSARLVVVGDSDFASDGYFSNYGNGDFMVNLVDWAAQQDNLMNLTPKTATERILVPPKETTLGLLFLGLVIVIPGMVIFAGVVTWLQRRNRG